MDYHLSPAKVAKRFGVSIKALRLYEEHGLLKPLRTSNGTSRAAWRVYSPDQLARLHQILALKSLGLSLGQIGELLVGQEALDTILAVQERVLIKDGERIASALRSIRSARSKIAAGTSLSIDDLSALTQETVMTTHPTAAELKEVITPFKQRHLTPGEDASLQEWSAGQKDLVDAGKGMMDEAKALMASGDATSAAAMDFARRFRALTKQLASGPSPVLALQPKIRAMVDDARSDPEASQKLEVFSFIERVLTSFNADASITKVKG